MIFYHIQAHDDFDYCRRLLAMIYSPENYYYISIDAAARRNSAPLIDAATRLGNVQIDQTKSVTWTGISLLNAMVVALRCFLAAPARHDWFVNISGVDLPLKTQQQMMSRLAALTARGVEACIDFGPPQPLDRVRYYVQQMAPHEQPRVWQPRSTVSFVIDRRIAHCFDGEFPYFDRFGFFVFDDTPSKRFIARPLLEIEALARQALFKRRPFRNGKAWHCLSRSWAEALFAHPDFPAVAATLSSMLLPDEMLIQTMATDGDDIAGDPRILRDNLRFHAGAPLDITDAYYNELFASDALFARKINLNHAPRVLERCAAICADEIEHFESSLAAPPPLPVVPPARARRTQLVAPCTLALGKIHRFAAGAEAAAALEAGWNAPEAWGVWSNGNYARIAFRVSENALPDGAALRCVLTCGAYIEACLTMQRIEILANGTRVYSGVLLNPALRELVIAVPCEVIAADRTIILEFLLPNAAAGSTIGMGDDQRPIALSLYQLAMRPVDVGEYARNRSF